MSRARSPSASPATEQISQLTKLIKSFASTVVGEDNKETEPPPSPSSPREAQSSMSQTIQSRASSNTLNTEITANAGQLSPLPPGSPSSGSLRKRTTSTFIPTITRTLSSGATTTTPTTPSIVFFGTTGVGKSSIINMLTNDDSDSTPPVAPAVVASCMSGVTTRSREFIKRIPSHDPFHVFDTPGIGEGMEGGVPTHEAVTTLHDLVSRPNVDIRLVVLVMRLGRMNMMEKNNYRLVRMLCGEEVPIVLVLTGVEQETDPDEQCRAYVNVLKEQEKFEFAGYAAVVATKGRNETLLKEYDESKLKVENLLRDTIPPAPQQITAMAKDKVDKFAKQVQKLLVKGSLDFPGKLAALIGEFTEDKATSKNLIQRMIPFNNLK